MNHIYHVRSNGVKAEQEAASPFWDNVRSWWAIRNLPNVMLVLATGEAGKGSYAPLRSVASLQRNRSWIISLLQHPISVSTPPKTAELSLLAHSVRHRLKAIHP